MSASTALAVLRRYKDATRQRFFTLVRKDPEVPTTLQIPADPAEAIKMGIRIGRQQGYGEGLVDGTKLGLDVGLETMEEALCQPVIFGPVEDSA